MKSQFLKMSDVTWEFLRNHSPSEIISASLLNINLPRVLLNLLNSLSDFFTKESKTCGLKNASLKDFINRRENQIILSNSIWLVIMQYNFGYLVRKEPKNAHTPFKSFRKSNSGKQVEKTVSKQIRALKQELHKQIALNYIALTKSMDKNFKRIIEKIYFDIVAQGVFYSLFYAFPKSRVDFNYNFRYFLFSMMSMFFTGLKISPVAKFSSHWNFVDDWYLDLGAGNVLAKKMYNRKSTNQEFENTRMNTRLQNSTRPNSKLESHTSLIRDNEEEMQNNGQTQSKNNNNTAKSSFVPSNMHLISDKLIHKKKLQFKKQMKDTYSNENSVNSARKSYSNFKETPTFMTSVNDMESSMKLKKHAKIKKQELKFSPLIDQYIKGRKQINRNCTPGFKIKLTPYFSILSNIERKNVAFDQKFDEAMRVAKFYDGKLKANTLNKALNKEINKIKYHALDNARRLHKRKVEETKNGAHEYANYILSILNSDLGN